jgi:hypothetical protein
MEEAWKVNLEERSFSFTNSAHIKKAQEASSKENIKIP